MAIRENAQGRPFEPIPITYQAMKNIRVLNGIQELGCYLKVDHDDEGPVVVEGAYADGSKMRVHDVDTIITLATEADDLSTIVDSKLFRDLMLTYRCKFGLL